MPILLLLCLLRANYRPSYRSSLFGVFILLCVCIRVRAFLGFSEVSCKTLEGFDGLKMLIYQVVLSMKDNSSLACGGKLLGRLVSKLII